MARSLVEHRSAVYRTTLAPAEAEARAKAALDPIGPRRLRLERRWIDSPDGLALHTDLLPSPPTAWLLKALSATVVLLIAAAAWTLYSERVERTLAFIVTIAAVLWVLALPLVVAALGAQRESEEARIARALNRALTDSAEAGGDRSR